MEKRPDGRFSKDRFAIDLDDNTVTCSAGQQVAIVALLRGAEGGPPSPPTATAVLSADVVRLARKRRSIL